MVLSDSLVGIGVLAKGRSSSYPLLCCSRYALAVAATTGIRLALRYVPTWLNYADGPSRGTNFPGVHPETVRKAATKWRRKHPGVDLPPSLRFMADMFDSRGGGADTYTPRASGKLCTQA